jgi:hypothetical protein
VSFQYYCYGQGGEYSLGPIEQALRDAGKNVVCAKNLTSEELKTEIHQSDFPNKVLLTSAHPGINTLTGRENLSIAELRRIYNWKAVAFFPHDLSEPFRWEERVYLNDYDFFVSEFSHPFWISAYIPVVHVEGLSRKKESINLRQDFLFLPDDFYSFGLLEPSMFVQRFPFVLQKNVVTKFVNVPEAHVFTDLLKKEFSMKILSPLISGFEIITPNNGTLVTQGPSSVLTEAHVSNMEAIYVYDSVLSDWMKQDLVNRFPAIVDFYSVQDGELFRRTRVDGLAETKYKALNISDLLAACEG